MFQGQGDVLACYPRATPAGTRGGTPGLSDRRENICGMWDWLGNCWNFLFGLNSGAWAAVAAWVAVLIGGVTILVTGWYAKKQIAQTRQQLLDAENDRLEQSRSDELARVEREQARAEQAREAQQARQQQADDALKLRELQARPNVVMFTEPMDGDWQFLEIVVKNFGRTPAFDIRIQLDTPPEMSPDYAGAAITKLAIPETIPILAPNQEWRALWDHAPDHISTDGIKNRHEGTVKYTDVNRAILYETPVVLDFNLLKDTQRIDRKTVHDVAKILKSDLASVNKELAAIAKTLDNYTSNEHKGVWVYLADPDAERQHRAAEAQQQAEQSRRNRERLNRMIQRRGGEA